MMRIASLFSGVGGFELGLGSEHELILLNEIDASAREVLRKHFPTAARVDDIRTLMPRAIEGANTLVAGFPCQDVSIVGGQRGLAGTRSALVEHVFRLAREMQPERILLENVQSIRFVHGGRVLAYIMHAVEELGYAWAYRILDSHGFGLPQRRRRFYFLASRVDDPGAVLLARPGRPLVAQSVDLSRPIGFYWTEGRRGNGLTDNALPPLKVGSAIGIPSPPAVLFPGGYVRVPTIETAERIQGFPAGWTNSSAPRQRWRLIGNAVSPPVVQWIAQRMRCPEQWDKSLRAPMPDRSTWPLAAWGDGRGKRHAVAAGELPDDASIGRLSEGVYTWSELSERALRGFVTRARDSTLRYPRGFLEVLEARLH